MRRPAFAVMNALVMTSFLSGSPSLAAEPTPDEAHMPLTSLSRRENFVFASTPDGLFRASLKSKKWERLKTPPGMPPNGTFAGQPGKQPQLFYVTLRSQINRQPHPCERYGLYLTTDNGENWELVSERDDFGATLLLPGGALFAVTGNDGFNRGSQLLRSTDLGKTWRDITGTANGQFMGLEPDPDHPGLVRIHAWAIRSYTFVADDGTCQWKSTSGEGPVSRKGPGDKFFARDSSSTNRFYLYDATLANYFGYDFGNQNSVQALEVVPLKTRFEFARGARVVVPIRVVFHYDPDTMWPERKKAVAEGHPLPKPTDLTEKFADQPGGIDFWGLRVESRGEQTVKYPPGRRSVTHTVGTTVDGKFTSTTYQAPAVKYQVFNLSPALPYEREIDLGRLFDFSKPGEYRVQLIYNSGGHPEGKNEVWDGDFTSPVFTIVIRE
jgi:hypothetical protein